MKVCVVSGGFDPVHEGHISYLSDAKGMGDHLIVALNSDNWLTKKKSQPFMNFTTRKAIISNLKMVDEVISFEDDELGSCINALEKVKKMYPTDQIMFCNGGDRDDKNIPEMSVKGIDFVFSVGGDNKQNSSSWILKKWKYYQEERVWGEFYNLYEDTDVKVKELVVYPGKGMSFQRHFHRNEIWCVSSGKCNVKFSNNEDPSSPDDLVLEKHNYLIVPLKAWHQIYNPYNEICKLIEIQYGDKTIEDDIERLHFFQENNLS